MRTANQYTFNTCLRRVAGVFGITLWSYTHHRPRPQFWAHSPDESCNEEPDLPTIGLVTPTYQHGHFLRGALESVTNQNYPNLSYAVCDGGSDDHSVDLLREFDSKLTCWTSAKDNGQSDAINRGFAMLKDRGGEPEIMGWLNADDRHLPWTLHTVGRYFRDHPEVDVVYGHRLICNSTGKVVGQWVLPKHRPGAVLWRDYVPQETLFWRKGVWDRVGAQVDPSLDFAMDWDLVVRFHKANAVMVRIPEFLGIFTTHQDQKSITAKGTTGIKEFAKIRAGLLSGSAVRYRMKRLALISGSVLYILRAAMQEWIYRVGSRKMLNRHG